MKYKGHVNQQFYADEMKDFHFIPEIFDHFEKQYRKSDYLYRMFIDSLDLGVVTNVTNANEHDYGKGVHSDYYKIIDEKKFMLARLKYGF
jgi:hypothetical protein